MRTLSALILVAVFAADSPAGCPDAASDLQVTVTPAIALPGQVVTVTVTNTSTACTYSLPTSCVFPSIHAGVCDTDPLVVPSCAGPPTPLGPGQSASQTWDLKDGQGQTVADGGYAFAVTVLDQAGQPTKLCPFVQVGTSCTVSPNQYGEGGAGSGGLIPSISSVGGYPQVGNASFDVWVTNALGGAPAVVFVGFAPAELDVGWGTFLIDPNLPLFSAVTAFGGAFGVPGQGILSLPVPIPSDPQLVALEVYFQVAVGDPAASGGIAHTEGLRVAICQ